MRGSRRRRVARIVLNALALAMRATVGDCRQCLNTRRLLGLGSAGDRFGIGAAVTG